MWGDECSNWTYYSAHFEIDMYQNITVYILNLHNVTVQLNLNKAGGKGVRSLRNQIRG